MDAVLAQGFLVGGVYALIALGFILVFKSSGVLNLAHAQTVAILSYLLYQMIAVWGLPSWLAIVVIIPLGAVLGVLIERLAVRPLLGQPFLSVLMMTLMVSFLLEGVRILVWGADSFTLPFTPRQGQGWLGTVLPDWVIPSSALAFVVAMLVFVLLMLLFRYTKVGLSMRVVAADHEVAQSLGIRVKRVFSISWALSGAFAAMCGVLVGMVFTVTPVLGDTVLGKGLPVLLLGGLNSIPGAVVGGLIIGLAELLGSHWFSAMKEVIPWIVMLVILLIRPYGLFGEKRIERI
ncbi:MAG: branched-chain amino acid ABC transporter permease [Dehalococcoidia bacterium]|nr:branched-chain amino acid ABC transporter permease [Dehalococcoidia bacterium]